MSGVVSFGGGGGSAQQIAGLSAGLVAGVPAARMTRPNNVTAYANGAIWGDAVDARNYFDVPALPAGAQNVGNFASVALTFLYGAPMAGPTVTFAVVPFLAQPATVLGDGAQIALSDADIALMPRGGQPPTSPFTIAVGSGPAGSTWNTAATLAGRRAIRSNFAQGVQSAPFQICAPGARIWFYLVVVVAYVPAALETLDILPEFTYNRKVLAL